MTGEKTSLKLCWWGRPATKKTSQQIARNRRSGKPFILPSQAYRNVLEGIKYQVAQQFHGPPIDRDERGRRRMVRVRVRYYLGARQRPDLSGLHEATGDLLQACGVLKNDHSIEDWDTSGGARFRDAQHPRTEIEIEVLGKGLDRA